MLLELQLEIENLKFMPDRLVGLQAGLYLASWSTRSGQDFEILCSFELTCVQPLCASFRLAGSLPCAASVKESCSSSCSVDECNVLEREIDALRCVQFDNTGNRTGCSRGNATCNTIQADYTQGFVRYTHAPTLLLKLQGSAMSVLNLWCTF